MTVGGVGGLIGVNNNFLLSHLVGTLVYRLGTDEPTCTSPATPLALPYSIIMAHVLYCNTLHTGCIEHKRSPGKIDYQLNNLHFHC